MPRHRNRFGYTKMKGPKVRVPKQKLSLPQPKHSVLVKLFKNTLTGSVASRTAVFFEIVGWWDNAINYYLSKSPLTPAEVKKYEIANKVRNTALGQGVTDAERINALERVIQLYEAIWGSQKVPSIKPYLEKFEATKTVLEEKEQKLTQKFSNVLDALNAAFKPLGIEVAVHKSEVPRQLDGIGKILLSQSLIKVLSDKARKEGLLPVIFSEAPTVLKAISIERDDQGNSALNLQKYFQQVPVMLQNVLQFCGTVARSTVFKASPESLEATVHSTVATAPSTPKAPRQPRPAGAPRTFGGGPLVGGKYKQGSAMAILYAALEDQAEHPQAEIFKSLAVSDPMGRVKALKIHGDQFGKWKVTINGGKIQMTLV